MIGILITYSSFFHKKTPKNSLGLISPISKSELITTISRINFLINPINAYGIDNSIKTQIECLKTILDQDLKSKSNNYMPYSRRFLDMGNNSVLFTRYTCFYAFNEILQSSNFCPETKTKYTVEERKGIFEYLLICNERINNLSEDYNNFDDLNSHINYFAFRNLPSNQYLIKDNIFTSIYKSKALFDYLIKDIELKKMIDDYLRKIYNVNNINEFFDAFIWIIYYSIQNNYNTPFLKVSSKDTFIYNFLNSFTNEFEVNEIDEKDVRVLDFLNIKKYPVFKSRNKNGKEFLFIIMDFKFFIQKTYSLFVNDFWFDYLKVNNLMKRDGWGKKIGSVFFEPFVFEIINNSFKNNTSYKILYGRDLELRYKRKSDTEVADLYISNKQKVFLGEIKSSFLNIADGFKTVSNINDYKKLNFDNFFDGFGLYQIVSKTLKDFHDYLPYIKDEKIDKNRKIHIYPALILNEPILSMGIFNLLIRDKFNDVLEENGIIKYSKYHIIYPLIIINIQDLQEMEESLNKNKIDFFNFLDKYYDSKRTKGKKIRYDKNPVFNTISDTINKNIKHDKLFPERLRKFDWLKKNNIYT